MTSLLANFMRCLGVAELDGQQPPLLGLAAGGVPVQAHAAEAAVHYLERRHLARDEVVADELLGTSPTRGLYQIVVSC